MLKPKHQGYNIVNDKRQFIWVFSCFFPGYTLKTIAVIHEHRERERLLVMTWLPDENTTAIKTRNGLQKVIYCYRIVYCHNFLPDQPIYFDRIEKNERELHYYWELSGISKNWDKRHNLARAVTQKNSLRVSLGVNPVVWKSSAEMYLCSCREWSDIPTAMSPESFVMGSVTTPEQLFPIQMLGRQRMPRQLI